MVATNVVATATLVVRNDTFQREHLALLFDAHIDSTFLKQALVARRHGVTLLIFNPTPQGDGGLRVGRIICTGARSPGHAKVAIAWFDFDLLQMFDGVRASGTRIFNRHSNGNFGFHVDKVGLYQAHPDVVTLDNNFPAARLKFKVGECTVGAEVFQSGMFNVAGLRRADQVRAATQRIANLVGPFLQQKNESDGDELYDTRLLSNMFKP